MLLTLVFDSLSLLFLPSQKEARDVEDLIAGQQSAKLDQRKGKVKTIGTGMGKRRKEDNSAKQDEMKRLAGGENASREGKDRKEERGVNITGVAVSVIAGLGMAALVGYLLSRRRR